MQNMGGGGRAPGSPGGYVAGITNLQNFQVNTNVWETLTQSLYDSAVYPAAGATSIAFFQQPVGQGTGFGGSAKTNSDTNMVASGMLPANQMFLIESFEVDFQPTTPTVAAQMPAVFGAEVVAAIVNDAYIFQRSGNFTLTVGAKPYLQEAPLSRLPASSNFHVRGALSDQTTPAANLQSRVVFGVYEGQPYIITPNNILLVSNQNFGVTLAWPEGVQAITNPARVFVIMNGNLYRKAQ